jgi:hypothetical protein
MKAAKKVARHKATAAKLRSWGRGRRAKQSRGGLNDKGRKKESPA